MDGRPSFELGRPIEGASQPNSDASEPTKTGPSIDHRPQPRVPIGPGSIAFPAMQASDAHKERLAIARRHTLEPQAFREGEGVWTLRCLERTPQRLNGKASGEQASSPSKLIHTHASKGHTGSSSSSNKQRSRAQPGPFGRYGSPGFDRLLSLRPAKTLLAVRSSSTTRVATCIPDIAIIRAASSRQRRPPSPGGEGAATAGGGQQEQRQRACRDVVEGMGPGAVASLRLWSPRRQPRRRTLAVAPCDMGRACPCARGAAADTMDACDRVEAMSTPLLRRISARGGRGLRAAAAHVSRVAVWD